MANGVLGRENLSAETDTTVYTVPADTFAVITVNVANRTTGSAKIRVSLSDSATPDDADFIEYDLELVANGVLERGGIVVDAGKNIIVRSDISDVSAVIFGIETPTN